MMKEELTTKQHAEFSVDPETDKQHRAQSALTLLAGKEDLESVSWVCEIYDIPVNYLLMAKQVQ